MRRSKKKKILELIDMFEQAHGEILSLASQGEDQAAIGLLSDCQESAISVGDMIIEDEGDNHSTIKILEKYCEFLYKASLIIAEEKSDKKALLEYISHDILNEIRASIREDITVKKQAIFMPYKASMWDSLESIWKEKSKDEHYECLVMPIPYYDKDSSGELKELHYEADLFPDYVPVTSYEKYDIEYEHPEEIYIHNPYDQANHVTSVHPFFYSKRIKEFTDSLIYVPYFVLEEPNLSNNGALKYLENFVLLPGVIHSHQVLVQSDNMRQAYIKVLSDYAGENTRPLWEQKIRVYESPKFTKLLATKREELEIPCEWLSIIQKEDGSWKKIILYNTSVTALLNTGELMLQKIERVLKIFYDNKDEIALLWRPHPLILSTIQAMRPELLEGYIKLVEEYKDKGFGIYDDTSDLDRALILSDAYYGDHSSLVQLCRRINKPVMIQNVYV